MISTLRTNNNTQNSVCDHDDSINKINIDDDTYSNTTIEENTVDNNSDDNNNDKVNSANDNNKTACNYNINNSNLKNSHFVIKNDDETNNSKSDTKSDCKPLLSSPSQTRNEMEKYFDSITSDDPSIEEVHLIGDPLFLALNDIEKMKAASSFANNTHVKTIIMNQLRLDDEFGFELCKSLQSNSSIEVLNLDSNNLSGAAIAAIIDALSSSHNAIVELQIRHQSQVMSLPDEQRLPKLFDGNEKIVNLGVDLDNLSVKMQIDMTILRNKQIQRKNRLTSRRDNKKKNKSPSKKNRSTLTTTTTSNNNKTSSVSVYTAFAGIANGEEEDRHRTASKSKDKLVPCDVGVSGHKKHGLQKPEIKEKSKTKEEDTLQQKEEVEEIENENFSKQEAKFERVYARLDEFVLTDQIEKGNTSFKNDFKPAHYEDKQENYDNSYDSDFDDVLEGMSMTDSSCDTDSDFEPCNTLRRGRSWVDSMNALGKSMANATYVPFSRHSKEFRKIDKDCDRKASREEISQWIQQNPSLWGMLQVNLNLCDSDCVDIATCVFMQINAETETTMGYQESELSITKEQFKNIYKRYIDDPKGAQEFFHREVFAAYDKDGSNYLDKKEFEEFIDVFYEEGSIFRGDARLPEKEELLDILYKKYDENHDGVFTFDEVKPIISGLAFQSIFNSKSNKDERLRSTNEEGKDTEEQFESTNNKDKTESLKLKVHENDLDTNPRGNEQQKKEIEPAHEKTNITDDALLCAGRIMGSIFGRGKSVEVEKDCLKRRKYFTRDLEGGLIRSKSDTESMSPFIAPPSLTRAKSSVESSSTRFPRRRLHQTGRCTQKNELKGLSSTKRDDTVPQAMCSISKRSGRRPDQSSSASETIQKNAATKSSETGENDQSGIPMTTESCSDIAVSKQNIEREGKASQCERINKMIEQIGSKWVGQTEAGLAGHNDKDSNIICLPGVLQASEEKHVVPSTVARSA